MPKLMPVSPELATALEEKFAESKFRSTDFFIDFYNSGLVNKAADEVVAFAQDVDATFKNVKLQGKTLVFISEAEVHLAEVLRELQAWDVLVKVKGRVAALVEAGELSEEAVLDLKTGTLVLVESSDEGGERTSKLSDEKFFKAGDEAMVADLASKVPTDLEGLRFRANDFLQLDTHFITEVHSVVTSR